MTHWTDHAEHYVYGEESPRYVSEHEMVTPLPSNTASEEDWAAYFESAYVDPMEWEDMQVCHTDPISAATALCGCGGQPYV